MQGHQVKPFYESLVNIEDLDAELPSLCAYCEEVTLVSGASLAARRVAFGSPPLATDR